MVQLAERRWKHWAGESGWRRSSCESLSRQRPSTRQLLIPHPQLILPTGAQHQESSQKFVGQHYGRRKEKGASRRKQQQVTPQKGLKCTFSTHHGKPAKWGGSGRHSHWQDKHTSTLGDANRVNLDPSFGFHLKREKVQDELSCHPARSERHPHPYKAVPEKNYYLHHTSETAVILLRITSSMQSSNIQRKWWNRTELDCCYFTPWNRRCLLPVRF